MRQVTRLFLSIITLLILIPEFGSVRAQEICFPEEQEGCTIGVASGTATSDGRPMIWKTRDVNYAIKSAVYYDSSKTYKYIATISGGNTAYLYQGVNERGFAVVNSVVYDLATASTGLGNGGFIKLALGNCTTVADFEHLLDSTNITGRQTRANYAVMDSTGAAKMIETGGNQYWVYDTQSAPNGYVVRTNSSIQGRGKDGRDRYNRSVKLVGDFYAGDSLNYRSIIRTQMRDFSDGLSNPVPIPYQNSTFRPIVPEWYLCPGTSICNMISISSTVVQGVLLNEPAKLTTMWNIIGQPATSIAVPYWPVGMAPVEAAGRVRCPLSDIAELIRSELFNSYYIPLYKMDLDFINTYALRDTSGAGFWATIFPAEDSIFKLAEESLAVWRNQDSIDINEMLSTESSLARYALSALETAYHELTGTVALAESSPHPQSYRLLQNYPNPFNPTTTIRYNLPEAGLVNLFIYDLRGRIIKSLQTEYQSSGNYKVQWNGINDVGTQVSTGVYFCRLEAGPFSQTIKMVYLR